MIELALHSATGDSADHTAAGNLTRAVFVGLDSAWADNAEAPGAICSVYFDGVGFMDFRPPELVGFDRSLDYIRAVRRPGAPTIVALYQPTIVPNATGMRPAEKVAGSLISWMGGGVQPANTGRPLFGPAAPVTLFLRKLGAAEDPEMARTAAHGIHLIEVFPALALASLEPAFFGLRKGPRYNPDGARHFGWRTGGLASRRRCVRRRIWAARPWSVGSKRCGRPRRRRKSTRTGSMQPCVY